MNSSELKQYMVQAGYIPILWHRDDIKSRAEDKGIELSNDQTDEVIKLIVKNHDCNIGINWEVIDIVTSMVINNK